MSRVVGRGVLEDGSTFEVTRERGTTSVQVNDTLYEINARTREGAAALARGIPYNCGSPYREGSARDQDWLYGHELAQDEKLAAILALEPRALARLIRETR